MPPLSLPVRRVGNSLGVLLPKKLVEELDLREGTVVDLRITRKKKVSGLGIARGAGPFVEKLDRDDIHEEFG